MWRPDSPRRPATANRVTPAPTTPTRPATAPNTPGRHHGQAGEPLAPVACISRQQRRRDPQRCPAPGQGGVMDQSIASGGPPLVQRLLQRIEHEVRSHRKRHSPIHAAAASASTRRSRGARISTTRCRSYVGSRLRVIPYSDRLLILLTAVSALAKLKCTLGLACAQQRSEYATSAIAAPFNHDASLAAAKVRCLELVERRRINATCPCRP
jgi:hypothetical protein